jgi:CIC family chloride channel protein
MSKKTSLYERIRDTRQQQIRRTLYIGFLSIFAGIAAALLAAVFNYLIMIVYNLLFQGEFSAAYVYSGPDAFKWGKLFIFIPALGLALASKISRTWAPDAAGHGVPEVMAAVTKRKGVIKPSVWLSKTLASALTIGAGGSAGRAGPVALIGAGIGSSFGSIFKLSSRERIILLGAGVAGGIGATFNAPIGGVMFALELIMPEYSIMTILPLVISSTVATHISNLYLEINQVYTLPVYELVSSYELLFYALLGLVSGLTALLFYKSLFLSERLFERLQIPPVAKALLGGSVIGLIGYVSLRFIGVYNVFGLGYEFLDATLSNNMVSLSILALLLVLKIITIDLTLSSGGSGGVFAPSLYLGAALGGCIGIIVNILFPETSGAASAYAIVGMAAMLSGVTGAVLTSIIMIFEMTGTYSIMLPLMLASVISHFTARLIDPETLYTQKLLNKGIRVYQDKRIPLLRVITVSEVMKTRVYSCTPGDNVQRTVERMHKFQLGLFPVIDGQLVVGTVSYTDLYERHPHPDDQIASYITRKKITIPDEASVFDALEVMQRIHSNILVAERPDGTVSGVITKNMILSEYLKRRRAL